MSNQPTEVKYAIHLADQHRDELGFLPRTIYEPMHAAGRLRVAKENSDPCGFLLHGTYRKTLRIYQTCVQPDARRIDHGSDLWQQLVNDCIANDVHQIELHCAEDLEANQFWQAVGCRQIGQRIKSRHTGRVQLRWYYELPAGIAHRATLDADPTEHRRNQVLDLMAKFTGNAATIKANQAKRRE